MRAAFPAALTLLAAIMLPAAAQTSQATLEKITDCP